MSRIQDPARKRRVVASLRQRDGDGCQLCGELIDFTLAGSDSRWSPSLDHYIPVSAGGSNRQHNLRLTHVRCNRKRGVADWLPVPERTPA
jgi:5-methylcytosine-specific restriction endonuclease McrA